MRKIIILCHGNICRSPMAEFILKDKIKKLKIEDEFEIASKALSLEEIGNDIYPPAKKCLDKHGIPYTHRQASLFNKHDYDYYDEIYIMDESNQRLINRMVDDKESKIKLLNGYIEDPWYTGNFDKVYNQIEEGINKILNI